MLFVLGFIVSIGFFAFALLSKDREHGKMLMFTAVWVAAFAAFSGIFVEPFEHQVSVAEFIGNMVTDSQ